MIKNLKFLLVSLLVLLSSCGQEPDEKYGIEELNREVRSKQIGGREHKFVWHRVRLKAGNLGDITGITYDLKDCRSNRQQDIISNPLVPQTRFCGDDECIRQKHAETMHPWEGQEMKACPRSLKNKEAVICDLVMKAECAGEVSFSGMQYRRR